VENTNRALYLAEWAKAANRVLEIAVGILVEHHLKTTDDLFDVRPEDRISGTPQASLERFPWLALPPSRPSVPSRDVPRLPHISPREVVERNDSVTTLA